MAKFLVFTYEDDIEAEDIREALRDMGVEVSRVLKITDEDGN